MFSQVSVCSQGGEGVLGKGRTCVVKGGHVWQRGACMAKGGLHGRGACVVRGMHGRGACVVRGMDGRGVYMVGAWQVS